MLLFMEIDLNLENVFLAAATITNSPVIGAIPIAYKTALIAYPSSIPYELPRALNEEEKMQVAKIKTILERVRDDLEISHTVPLSIHIASRFAKDSCMLGSTHSIEGPILVLSSAYLKAFSPHDDLDEWNSELSALPDNPVDLAKKLATYSEAKLARLKELSYEFLHKPSEQELTSVIAHELGHAKYGHALKEQGFFALALIANKVATVIAIHFGFHLLYAAISVPLTYFCAKFISKKIEQEADNVCVYQYKRGAADFHKKRVIVQLLNSYSKKYEQIVIGMLNSWDLFYDHPNAAKRLLAASNQSCPALQQKDANVSSQALSILGIVKMLKQNLTIFQFVITGT